MPLEIERKFLVRNEGWRENVRESYAIRQGYLMRGKRATVRIRRARDKGFITIKGAKSEISRAEFEYEIPVEEADEMLDTLVSGQVIEKHRHLVVHDGRVWEIDEFARPRRGLVLAEIELESADEEISLPDWAGEEVTENPSYGNAMMSAPADAPQIVARASGS